MSKNLQSSFRSNSTIKNNEEPQIGGKNNVGGVKIFLKGLKLNGLGYLVIDDKKNIFKLAKKENCFTFT